MSGSESGSEAFTVVHKGQGLRCEVEGTAWRCVPAASPSNSRVISVDNGVLTCAKIIVVDSVAAGRSTDATTRFYTTLLKPVLEFVGVDHVCWQTTSAQSTRAFAKLVESRSLVVFLSGDTSISEFMDELEVRTELEDVSVLPVPLGSGNAIANSLGMVSPLKSIQALLSGIKVHMPLYKVEMEGVKLLSGKPCESAHFLIVFSWALHSTLVYESDKAEMRRKYGTERFAMAAKAIAQRDPHFRTVDGRDLSYLLVTSMPKLEATFTISPDSDPTMDQLHVVEMDHTDPRRLMEVIMKGYNQGAHVREPDVRYNVLSTFPYTLRLDPGMDPELCILCLDGRLYCVDPKVGFISLQPVIHNRFFYLTV